MKNFRRFLLRHPLAFAAWRIALTFFGKLVLFWRRPQITDAQIEKCYAWLRSGDIIGVGSKCFVTGLFLPRGKYDVEHSVIYIGYGLVVEAIAPRVRVISLRRFLRQYDRVIIGQPKVFFNGYCSNLCVNRAFSFVDRPYDVTFSDGRRLLYCHEMIAECFLTAGLHLKKVGEFWVFDDLAAVCKSVKEVK
jgi:hypothetical protein